MPINLEAPRKFRPLVEQAHQVAEHVLRPISRRYDGAGHERPVELDMLASMIDGVTEGSDTGGAGATGVRRSTNGDGGGNRNGGNLSTVLSVMEMCWGDVGLLLSIPRQGLGNAAIASVADMAIEVEGMRLTTYRAASLLDAEKDAAHATTIARRLCADKGMVVGSQGVQLLGGHGYVKEYPVERWYRDLRATAVMEGAVMV